MSNAHQQAIEEEAKQRLLKEQVQSFRAFECPFCNRRDLYAYPPGTRHWTGVRTWWTIGCESRACNSCWTLNADSYRQAWEKLSNAQRPI